MRVRTIAMAGVAAIALTLGTTAAASAHEPPRPPEGEGKIFICKDGELTERKATDEDLRKFRERFGDHGGDGRMRVRVDEDGRVEVLPDGPGRGDVHFERRGDGRPHACAVPEK